MKNQKLLPRLTHSNVDKERQMSANVSPEPSGDPLFEKSEFPANKIMSQNDAEKSEMFSEFTTEERRKKDLETLRKLGSD